MITHFINIKNFLPKLLCLIILCTVNTSTHAQNTSVRGAKEEAITNKIAGNQYALVVGISKYQNITPLLYADDDAQSFKNFLTDTKLVPEANVHMLLDSTATRSRFYAEIKKIMDKLKENDRVIIYFAGHGDVDNDIDAGFLLGYNCEATPYAASDAIDIAMLERYVDAITKKKVKVILISDACRSGKLTGGAHGAELTLTALSSRFKNTVKILSCGPGELSEETNFRDGGHGIFTYYLLQALYGLSDEDNNNVVTKKEIDKFLREKVSKATSDRQNRIMEGNANEEILNVIPELKQAMLAKAQNTDGNNKPGIKRNFSQTKIQGVSSQDSMLIKKFYTQIKEGKLNTPKENNAYETYQLLKNSITNNEVISSIKYDLAAALEDAVQPLLNRVTRGEFQETPYELYDTALKKLDIINKELLTKDDYRYNDITALQLYFNSAGYVTDRALKDLMTADSLHPNTAYINCEIGRYYSRKQSPDSLNAFKYFRKSMRLAPTWPYPHLVEGLLYLDIDMPLKAKASFEKALSLKKDFKLALINMGVAYNRLKEYDKEMSFYRTASLISSPNSIVLNNNIGLYWKGEGRLDSALYYYKKGYALDTANIINYGGIINVFIKLNRKDSATYYLNKVINLKPTTREDYTSIADSYFDLGKFEEAINFYKQAITIKPKPYLYNSIGTATEYLNRDGQAKIFYNLALRLEPANKFSLKKLAQLFIKEQNFDSAMYYTGLLEKADHFDNTSLESIAEVYLSAGKYEKAIDYYRKAIAIKPSAYAYNNLGLTYYKLQKYDSAKKYYLLALTLIRDYPVSISNLGGLYYELKKYDSSVIYYKKLLEIEPAAKHVGLVADAFYMGLRYDSSIVYYLKAIALDSTRFNYFANLGNSYLLSGKIPESVPYFERSLALDSTYGVVYSKLAIAYISTDKYEQAINYLNKILSKDTSDRRTVYYVIAIANAKAGKLNEALSALEASIKYGVSIQLLSDKSLDIIRTLPQFRQMIETHFKKEEIKKHPKIFGNN